ncbi:UPF0496 PROTEIN 3-RELATED [Salix purpurea]|uniref:UPF0496 PROTEIN 3-RELATED n=1 Tax=Salix purpurea TaxID=77065 RepID=A0A9Q0ZMQ9_SALPP|nr:UPF0496 PROTEIN 3-RELATED [Salix purpurea]
MLEKLLSRKKKLDEKLKSIETRRRVSIVLFVSAFVSVLIFSVLAAAVAARPVVTALAGAITVPIGSVGYWRNTLWNRYEKALKEENGLVSSIQAGTSLTIWGMDSIRLIVVKLQVEIESLLNNADFSIREEDAVKLVIDKIKKKMTVFMDIIEDLAVHADKCNHDISQARKVILNSDISEVLRYV